MAARKRTRFMSNAGEILNELGRLCKEGHEHGQLLEGRAREAARYLQDFVKQSADDISSNGSYQTTM